MTGDPGVPHASSAGTQLGSTERSAPVGRVLEDLQKQHGSRQTADAAFHAAASGAPVPEESADSIQQAIADLENIPALISSRLRP